MRQHRGNVLCLVGLASVIAIGFSAQPTTWGDPAATPPPRNEHPRLARPSKVQDLCVDGITLGANAKDMLPILRRSGWRKTQHDRELSLDEHWVRRSSDRVILRIPGEVQFIEGNALFIGGERFPNSWRTVGELTAELSRVGFTVESTGATDWVGATAQLPHRGRNVEVTVCLTFAGGYVARSNVTYSSLP